MRVRIGVLNDEHVGSMFGLWPDNYPTSNSGIYQLNQGQRYLLDNWNRIAAEIPPLDLLIFAGDEMDGKQPKSEGAFICEPKAPRQKDAALELLSLFKKRVKRGGELYSVEGTDYHMGKNAEWSEELAKSLGAVPMAPGRTCWDWLLLEVGGKRLDVAHRQTVTIIRRSSPGERELDFSEMHKNPADLVIRAHNHYYFWLTLSREDRVQHYLSCPAWQLQTHYCRTSISPNRKDGTMLGMVVVTIEDGEISHRPYLFPHPPQRRAVYVRAGIHDGRIAEGTTTEGGA